MMAGTHPSDIELLEYAEGELEEGAADAVSAHLGSCPACASEVADAQRARDVLRASPLLELPEERLRTMVGDLPRQEPERSGWRALFSSPRRSATVLAPVAVAVVAVVIVTTTTGGEKQERSEAREAVAAQTEAATAAGAAAPPAAEGGSATLDSATPAASVKGPARDVVRLLRQAGFTARRVPGGIEVSGADRRAVVDALGTRPEGRVRVFVAP